MEIEQLFKVAYDAFTRALDQKLTTPETDVSIAPKFYHGTLVMKPKDSGLQSKEIDLEVFFKKLIALRNNLRVLEMKINASPLDEAMKLELDGYITKCYGSLTTFNVLFQDQADRLVGSSKD